MNSIWLYLEPYTFISEDDKRYYFYNSNDFVGFSVQKEDVIEHLIRNLKNPENLYSVRLDMQDLLNQSIFSLVRYIQSSNCGDLLEGNFEKPVLFPPILNLQKTVERLKENTGYMSDEILSYLQSIVIYLNGSCLYNCKNCLKEFKQQVSCTKNEKILDFESLTKFLFSISYTGASVTLVGGDIFRYKKIDELLLILDGMNTSYTLVSDWRNLPEDSILEKLSHFERIRLKLIIHQLDNISAIESLDRKIADLNIQKSWDIFVCSEEELGKAESFSSQFSHSEEVFVKPIYDGTNKSFFEEYVYIDQEELDGIELTRQNIFALQVLNTNDFGKIVIMPDGKVYANLNDAPLGNIGDPIKLLMTKELESKNSWRRTRYDLEPCSQCRFKLICPSISNYERVMNKNNLCHIRP